MNISALQGYRRLTEAGHTKTTSPHRKETKDPAAEDRFRGDLASAIV